MYTYGTEVNKDTYGRVVKVGDLIDTYEWYSGILYVTRSLVIGTIPSSGNYRIAHLYENPENETKLHLSWAHKNQPVLAPPIPLESTKHRWVNEYLKGDQEQMFTELLYTNLTAKELKKYKLDI